MDEKIKQEIMNNRNALKPSWAKLRRVDTPRKQNMPSPELFKKPSPNIKLIDLLKVFPNIKQKTLTECIKNRRSLRKYEDTPLSFEEVSYLLWETSRVDFYKKTAVFRSIPTGGARNAMETYVYLNKVSGFDKGLYHYVQDQHKLALIDDSENIESKVDKALFQQLRGASIAFFFTAIPYRSEHKYSFCAHKMIAMGAGHACQNLSLSAEIIECGACAIAAYDQELLDDLLQVEGIEEFATYAVTVGKK
jgi:SagB-type dehydrogenase family enzyme